MLINAWSVRDFIFNAHLNSDIGKYNINWSKASLATNIYDNGSIKSFEPVHEISNNVVCSTSKASDQPAHMRSLIRAFASRLSILRLLRFLLNTIWSF